MEAPKEKKKFVDFRKDNEMNRTLAKNQFELSTNIRNVFTQMSHAHLASSEVYNIMGVVIDAVYPYKKTKNICSLRIIDNTINSLAAREEST